MSYDQHQLDAVLVTCPQCGHLGYRTQVHGLYTGPCSDCDRQAWLEWYLRGRHRVEQVDVQGNPIEGP
jgi:hypothetical protein